MSLAYIFFSIHRDIFCRMAWAVHIDVTLIGRIVWHICVHIHCSLEIRRQFSHIIGLKDVSVCRIFENMY